MGWKRQDYRTTVLGILKGAIVILPMVFPPIAPIATAAYGLADAIFGWACADRKSLNEPGP